MPKSISSHYCFVNRSGRVYLFYVYPCRGTIFSVVFIGARAACGTTAGCNDITLESISYKFGIVMTLSGLLGVPVGSLLAQNIRHKECALRHFFYLL
jgi:hypothetical protein